MNILDESVRDDQWRLLRDRHIAARKIGGDIAHKGLKDDAIIPFLLDQPHPTFFTPDLGFYQRTNGHPRYCLAIVAAKKKEFAALVRRLLRHPEFDTEAKRMGAVIRVSPAGLTV